MEYLTEKLAKNAWTLIEEVEDLGGMTKAIEAGIPKMRIEEAAAKKQARMDSCQDIIVGVNKYRLDEEEEMQILEVDNREVRRQQLERLAKTKRTRNATEVEKALQKLTEAARKKMEGTEGDDLETYNLLALAVNAARARATLGEISFALEVVFGRA